MTPEKSAISKAAYIEQAMKKAKLEPCPFCGGEARILIYYGCGEALYSVACTDPRCIASEGRRKYLDVTDAVKAWNRRD